MSAQTPNLIANLIDSLRCMSRGPRIGNEGTPYCKRPIGHEGRHRPDPSDGWEPGMDWGDPK